MRRRRYVGNPSTVDQMLTPPKGLRALSRLGVDHRDVSIGNVFLGTDPEKAAGFISDLDLSSISEEAIKAAHPNDHKEIIDQMKDGEWRTVCDYRASELNYLLTDFRSHREQQYSWPEGF